MGILHELFRRGRPAIDLADQAATGDAADTVRQCIAVLRDGLAMEERRSTTADHLEAVLDLDDLEAALDVLDAALGPPAKPFGARATFSTALAAMVDTHGGIARDQSLHLRRFADGRVAFAAIWPWADREHATLKLGVYAGTLPAR